MRTLIVYASKNGATKECAQFIEKRVSEESTVINLSKEVPDNLIAYDTVLIGSSVYAGRMRPEIKRFYEKNAEALKGKNVFVFLSCLDKTKKEEYLASVFPKEFIGNIKKCVACGGTLDMRKLNFFERLLMKKIMKEKEPSIELNTDTVIRQVDEKEMEELAMLLNK